MSQVALKAAPSPEPVATLADVMDKVRALLPGIRARVEESERDRSIPAVSAQEFLDIGLARALMPKRYGGTERRAVAGAQQCHVRRWQMVGVNVDAHGGRL